MVTARVILSNTFVQVAGKVAIGVLGLITAKMLATYLRVEERGLYELTYTFLGFVGIAADMGLYTIAIREMSKHKEDMPKIIGNILTIRNFLSVGVLVVALALITVIPSLQLGFEFTLGILLAGFSTVLALLNGTLTSVLQVHYKMMHATLAQVFGKMLTVVFMAVSMFAVFQKASPGFSAPTSFWGFESLFIAGVVGNILMCLYTQYHARKLVEIHYRFDFGYWKYLFKETFAYGLALILGTIYFKIDVLILQFMLPQTGVPVEQTAKFQIGLYSGAVKVVEVFNVLPGIFLNATLPIMSRLLEEKSEKLKTLIQYSFDFLFLMAAPIVVGGYVLSYQIINLTNSAAYLTKTSEGFVGSDMVLEVIIFTILFSFLNTLFNFFLVAQNRQRVMIWINVASLVFNVVGNIIFIPTYGLLACAMATVATEFLVLVLTYIYSRQGFSFSLKFTRILKITLAAVLMGVSVYFTQDYFMGLLGSKGFVVVAAQAGLVYGACLWIFRVVDREMWKLMRKG